MNKIEKMKIKTDLVEGAYDGAIDRIRWHYSEYDEENREYIKPKLDKEKLEQYEYAMEIVKEIEDILTTTKK